MSKSLNEVLSEIGTQLGVEPQTLIGYADEDSIGGFHADPGLRKWSLGSMWEVEAQLIYVLVRALRPDRVLECGVGNACTSAHVLAALEKNERGELVSLDPQPYGTAVVGGQARWIFHRQDAVQWLRDNPGEHFDMVIEDAMHDYEQVRDIISLVKPRHPRIVLSHDAEHFLVGKDIVRAWTEVYGVFHSALIEPSDCGFSWFIDDAWTPQPNVITETGARVVSIEDRTISFDRPPGVFVYETNGPIDVDLPGPESVLYLPIIETGDKHDLQARTKHGLRDALSQYGLVREVDYLAIPKEQLFAEVMRHLSEVEPSLLFTQFHGPDRLTADNLRAIRASFPHMRLVNWAGDYWPESLTSDDMLVLLKEYDLQLVINGDVLSVYTEHGINAAYWQFGYETAVDPLPEVPGYDVIYLGTNYSEKRKALGAVLRGLDCSVGIYGMGWEDADGECTYDFAMGEALYKHAKIAISDNQWPTADGYVSNRPFQAMCAGCFVLQQRIANAETRLGFEDGVHYVVFDDYAEIPALVTKWLKKGNEPRRRKIAKAAQALVMQRHTFDVRVKQLFEELLSEAIHAR